MKKTINMIALLALIVLAAGLNNCLLEDREVEIVLNQDHCEEIYEYHTSENYTTPKTFEIGEELDSILVENDINKEQITDAFLMSAHYEVTEYEHAQEWELEGVIMVQRDDMTDGPDTLIIYTELMVGPGSVGDRIAAVLHADGVTLVNQAIDDYLAGSTPILTLTVISGDVDPSPTPSVPLEFWWEACMDMQVIYNLDTEIVDGL